MYLGDIQTWIWSAGTLVGSTFLGLALHLLLFHTLRGLAQRNPGALLRSLWTHCRGPSRIVFPLLAVNFSLPLVEISPKIDDLINKALSILLTVAAAWLLIKLTSVMEEVVLSRYNLEEKDNLRARKIHTQLQIIKKILVVAIGIVALSAVLMSFERFRQLGTGLLASVGLAGLILGIAARFTISNLLAGIQIALTQPIRLDDVVIAENEWGRIEEITLTYVVVRIWDSRCLILPISYFMEKPFQNWTRVSPAIIGSIFIHVDYTVPVQEVREEFHRLLQNSKWDGRVWALQVTNAGERTMELRAIMSAPDSSSAWELRCEMREKLIEFIQKKYPHALPKLRTEVSGFLREEGAEFS